MTEKDWVYIDGAWTHIVETPKGTYVNGVLAKENTSKQFKTKKEIHRMEGKRELELDILMEVYDEELFEIAVDNAQLEGVCACENMESGDKHYDFDFHEDIEDLFLYALRDGNLYQFDALLMLNDILLNVDIDIANEEMGEEEEEESMAGVMEKNRDKIFDIAVENSDLSGVSAYVDENGEKKYGFTVHHKVDKFDIFSYMEPDRFYEILDGEGDDPTEQELEIIDANRKNNYEKVIAKIKSGGFFEISCKTCKWQRGILRCFGCSDDRLLNWEME